jgi:hypothetical protein
MLVKAFDNYKSGMEPDEIATKLKKFVDYKTKNSKRKIVTFDDFMKNAMLKEDGKINEMKYLTGREKLINENNAVKAEMVLSKLNSKDLPEAEGLDCKNSQVGSYMSADEISELYGDEFGGILKHLGKDGMLVYCWGKETAWWQRKIDGDGDDGGLVRVE